jgi:hypothetical protein
MGRELLCNAGRRFSDNSVVSVERECEDIFCVKQVEKLVIIV